MDGFDDFLLLQQLTKRELINLLESIPGTKEIIVEKCLMRPLDKLVTVSLLAQNGCPKVQQLHMDQSILWDTNLSKRVFICRPSLNVIQKVIKNFLLQF